ncbi:DUF4419 domain-containing protein [Paludisphaera rhizosphaerae]|uniref:DUF4419 domain-containing protein n=1 Tax=Paludisphaera rhizosphaerae TaxID=2711216 RepID=UPI0013EC06A1|nr:DUF4419 domain-containing protein [Paludisphaera rhizosphaerae]
MKIAESVTFPVSAVAPAGTLLPEVPYKQAVETLLTPVPPEDDDWDDEDDLEDDDPEEEEAAVVEEVVESRTAKWFERIVPQTPPSRPVEACARYHGRLVANLAFHPVVAAVHYAFHDHRPLRIGPDAVWLMVIQAVANHVNAHPEELRGRFVQHDGRASIVVRRDDFVKGSPENPWPEVFGAFSTAIRDHVGPVVDQFTPSFSTTGPVERAAAEVVLLAAMQSYFQYSFDSFCGIPTITLEGTTADWEALAERVESFEEFGLARWIALLQPILGQFVRASRGDVDARFWRSIYKLESESGGPYVTGWITAFFPYLTNPETGRADAPFEELIDGDDLIMRVLKLPGQADDGDEWVDGPTFDQLPGGLSIAPFLWKCLGREYSMEFLGGFVGVSQDAETFALRPEIGWAVREAE